MTLDSPHGLAPLRPEPMLPGGRADLLTGNVGGDPAGANLRSPARELAAAARTGA